MWDIKYVFLIWHFCYLCRGLPRCIPYRIILQHIISCSNSIRMWCQHISGVIIADYAILSIYAKIHTYRTSIEIINSQYLFRDIPSKIFMFLHVIYHVRYSPREHFLKFNLRTLIMAYVNGPLWNCSQNTFDDVVIAVRQQAITWAKIDTDLGHPLASPDHNEGHQLSVWRHFGTLSNKFLIW